MNRIPALSLMAILFLFGSCDNSNSKDTSTLKTTSVFPTSNPFFNESTLPLQAIPFDRITNEDFSPAYNKGMKDQIDEISIIANNSEAPTFDNTLLSLEKSGRLLSRVQHAFNVLSGANTNPDLQKLQEDVAPKMAAHQDAIYLNTKLFKRVEQLYNQRNELKLDPESLRLVEYYYQQFVLAGAMLTDEQKNRLKKLNEEEASLSAKFNNQLLAATKNGALVISDSSKLSGLSSGEMAAASQASEANKLSGKWYLSLQNTTQQPELQSLTNRDTRQQLFNSSWTRAEKNDANDTRATIARIAQLRAEKAQLVGFKNYAEWKLQDQMAKTTSAVDNFFAELIPAATAKARVEAADIQAVIDKQKGGFQLEPWDWNFYAEQVRKAKYDLNDDEIKPYFELNTVLENGVFYAAQKLYGLTFKERKDLPVYQPDVRVFTVFEENGDTLGLFYCDYFKRDNKNGGAWMDNMVGQSKLFNAKPVIYNVCNFTKPANGQPALISFDDVTTMFHEFGHALHGFFASQKYPSLSGTNVARDFVEFPSQFNQNWALYPEVLKNYAKNYKTGETIPQSLVDKIKKAATFNQGYALTEILAAADLDMEWHKLTVTDSLQNVNSFQKMALKRTGLDLPQVPPRYSSSYFLHIWSNGYAAGYYAYLWTEMLDHDAYQWFTENGGMTRANGQRFRDMVLSRGNTEDLAKMYSNWRGHAPSIAPMIKARGLK
ncbi:MAG: peptidyl-dipeptidase Dcp [Ginsengibacter sp.]